MTKSNQFALNLARNVITRKKRATGGTGILGVPDVKVPGTESKDKTIIVASPSGKIEIDPATGKPVSPADGGNPATAFAGPAMPISVGLSGGEGVGGGDGTAGGMGDTAGGGGYGSDAGNADSAGGSPAGDGGGPMGLARGGMPKNGKSVKVMAHVGPINSSVAGRTDHLPMHVKSGSYVIPADIISAMGEGNTMSGFKTAQRIFGGTPYKKGSPYGQSGGPYGAQLPHKAEGGEVNEQDLVPIIAAGGEYVISPESVVVIGKGNLDHGHQILDAFVKKMREKTIKTLQKLPGPKKD